MSVIFHLKNLVIYKKAFDMPWPLLCAIEHESKVFVLLDPDSYTADAEYRKVRRSGGSALRNLWAFDAAGIKLWEAELPGASDYYYKICSVSPLIVNSFSSYRCEIDAQTGSIRAKEFTR